MSLSPMYLFDLKKKSIYITCRPLYIACHQMIAKIGGLSPLDITAEVATTRPACLGTFSQLHRLATYIRLTSTFRSLSSRAINDAARVFINDGPGVALLTDVLYYKNTVGLDERAVISIDSLHKRAYIPMTGHVYRETSENP